MDEPARHRPRDSGHYTSNLRDLAFLSGDEQRVVFRRTFTELSRETFDGPGPLEGVPPKTLVLAAKNALEAGLVDDLAWLAPEAAGRALFTFASALPGGPEQRDVGRRALSMLVAGNATTFAAIATVMARTGAKAFSSAPVIARTGLLFELPLHADVADGSLAFTLAVRKQLARDWILGPSTRSLAARRLAGRVIERAASELVRRAEQHMTSSIRFFVEDGPLKGASQRLLDDRESLVWRHAAVARGLLAATSDDVLEEVAAALSPTLSPTEWRRGIASVAALAGVNPELALELASSVFRSDIPRRDPGVFAALLWGLPRAAETEPEAAAELFALAKNGPPGDVAEAVLYIRRELGTSPFVDVAMRQTLEVLQQTGEDVSDDGAVALRRELLRDLDSTPRDDDPLRRQVEQALDLFAIDGAESAHNMGLDILASASSAVEALEALGEGAETAMARRAAFSVLRDLDGSVLDRDVLVQLIRLATNVDKARTHEEALGTLRSRIARCILAKEAPEDGRGAAPEPTHLVLHLSRVRALLHLVDADTTGWSPATTQSSSDDTARALERHRWQMTSHAVLSRIEARPSRALRRALLATLARAVDGLVRGQACDAVDALLVVSEKITDAHDFDVVAEASMDPDLSHVLSSYAAFVRRSDAASTVAKQESQSPEADGSLGRLAALEGLAEALLTVGSARSEALRAVLTRLGASLLTLTNASSLRALTSASGELDVIYFLETSAEALRLMARGARARVFEAESAAGDKSGGTRVLTTAIARVLSGSEDDIDTESLALGVSQLTEGVPRAIRGIIRGIIMGLAELPRDGSLLPLAPVLEEPLPEWVPARRVLGAFYVLKPLSAGAAGSVFVVCRAEDRRDREAERFALKVPDFSANAARHLSEAEFNNLFRAEAGALVALPPHENLAQLVTFDLSARPRPILVMELVEGPSLERVIDAGALDLKKAWRVLDQVLAGLEVMHEASIGHLDLKPANVVLRNGETAVLVDFGLAGKNIRPGCATGPYGAPEVWGAAPEGTKLKPMPADVYAFGCLAFEVLTGTTLFEEANEIALISSHIAHDGLPPKVRALSKNPKLSPLVEFLFSALRRSPAARVSAKDLRADLAKLEKRLEGLSWPLAAGSPVTPTAGSHPRA